MKKLESQKTAISTKWVESVALKDNKAQSVAKFLYHNIMTRFGCPVKLKKSTSYHPQANGQAESTNKTLIKILKKIVQEDKTDWDEKLDSALWSFRTAFKVTTCMTPFRRKYLMQLEEDRFVSSYITEIIQRRRKAWVSMNVKFKVFQGKPPHLDWLKLDVSNAAYCETVNLFPSHKEQINDGFSLADIRIAFRKGVVLRINIFDAKDEVDAIPEEDTAPMSSSKMMQSLMELFTDFKVELDCQADTNEKWLKAIGLYEFATLPWGQWKANIYAKTQMELLRKSKGAVSKKVSLTPVMVAQEQGRLSDISDMLVGKFDKVKTLQELLDAGYSEQEAQEVLASPEHTLIMGDLLKTLSVETQTPSKVIGKTFNMSKKRKLDTSMHEVVKTLDFSTARPSSSAKVEVGISDVSSAVKMLQALQGFITNQ
ncbi:hypothetical protein L7F22_054091 [Adiantum nelumboides]|nr:hypothetical protein [Adiantum nelumboides]